MNTGRRVDKIITYYGKGVTPKYVDTSSIIVLNQKCIRNNRIDYSLAQYIDDSKTYNEDKLLREGDILINSTGQGTAGRVAFVDKLPDGKKLIVDSHILVLRTNSFYEAKCLNYSLYSIEKLLQTFMDGSTGQGEFDKIRLFNLRLNFSENEGQQQKIASVLSALDDKIENNNKINTELEAMAKTLYDYWFVQFDFPDASGKPYKSSGGKMVYNEKLKREIPEGWEVKSLGEYALVKKGTLITEKTANINGNVKVVSAGLGFSYYHDKANFSENTITVSASGANAGFVNFWREPIFACDCTVVKGKNLGHTLYCFEFLKHMQDHIYKQARGSAQPHVYPKDLQTLNMTVPNIAIFEKYSKIVEPLNEKVAVNIKQKQELAALRDWLLPMLMNGQVTVGDAVDKVEQSLTKVVEAY
jgi:type I restriction enzyme S subunit